MTDRYLQGVRREKNKMDKCFFFQAEDGIRDIGVTGVQTCALPISDTVTHATGLNLSSDLLGSLYNPFAAVPSLHFGYALLVGASVALIARRPLVRAAAAAYPVAMLFIIVATGNHFFLDAAAGALAIGVGFAAASWVDASAKP